MEFNNSPTKLCMQKWCDEVRWAIIGRGFVISKLEEMDELRRQKKFVESDSIRKLLNDLGLDIENWNNRKSVAYLKRK